MFTKASKKRAKSRTAIDGPSGSGKTYTAILFAQVLAEGGKIALIDSERGSASKYAGDVADFDVCELDTFEPRKYVEALNFAASAGYPVVIIDSLSHAWTGEGGILDQVDKRGGRFDAWREATPMHRELVDTILAYPGHVIATMRSKTEYAVDKDAKTGRTTVTKLGLAPEQRSGMEYEFDVICSMNHEHTMKVTKSRCRPLADEVIRKPGAEVAQRILDWLNNGAVPAADQIYGLIVGGDIEQAKALTREHWKRLGRIDRERITTSIKAAEAPDDDTPTDDTPETAEEAAE